MNTVRCPLQSGDEGATLLSYFDRRLDPDLTEALDRHVAICPDCARLTEAQRAVWDALEQWEPVAVSADFDARVMARIAAEPPSLPWWRRWFAAPSLPAAWWKPAMPLAVACVAVMAVAVWRGPISDNASLAPSMDTAEAQQVEDVLADLEMLRQLGVTEAPASAARQSL
jgi:anti-sigma factor RsiW